jgi:hypothetical protein
MSEIQLDLEEAQEILLDDVDVGVAGDTLAFDVTGRIVGLDESVVGRLAGDELVPVSVTFKAEPTLSN